MKVFISGASGVIGRRVAPLLLAAGHEVTAMVRPGSPRRSVLPAGCSAVEASLFDHAGLARAVAGHQAVINLATHIPRGFAMMLPSGWRETGRIRSEGAANFAEAAAETGARILVQESFSYAYPDSGASWIDEDTPLRPASYCRSVLDAEAAARRFSERGGVGVVLRFAGFYGPDAVQMPIMAKAARAGWAALPGDRSSYISSISHDDAATAVAAALTAPSGPYNACDDAPVSHEAYFAMIAEAVGARPPRFLPTWAAPLMGVAGPTLARSIRLSNARLKAATGWAPRCASVGDCLPAAVRAACAAA